MRSSLVVLSCVAVLALAGCGSDAGTASTPPPAGNNPPPVTPPAPAPVEGIATPSSVAVVTATNA
jgi:hypothetical protein